MVEINRTRRLIKCLLVLALLPFSTQIALANGIVVTGDSVTISASGVGFGTQAKSLLSGTIPNTDFIPAASIASDLTSTFNVAAATGATIAAGTYTFQGGMFIDQDGSSRRLEISVSGISLTFDATGNITSGSIAAGTNAVVSGRSADGAATAVITLTNSLLSITDSTFSITAGAQIAEIQGSANIILQDLTTTFTAAASYDYGIFLKQTGGLAGLTFGLTDGTTFFGCAAGNPMALAGQSSFAGASALAGRMGVGQAAGGTATAYTGTCVTVPALSGGGGGGGAPAEEPLECDTGSVANEAGDACVALSEQAEEELGEANAGITALDEGSPPTEIAAAVEDLTDAGDEIASLLADGIADPELGLGFIDSAKTAADTVSSLGASDPDATAETLSGLLTTIGTVAGSINPEDLTAQQLTDLNTDIADTINSVTALLAAPGDLSDGAKATLIAAAEDLLAGSVSANKGVLNEVAKASLVAVLDELKEEEPGAKFTVKIDKAKLSSVQLTEILSKSTGTVNKKGDKYFVRVNRGAGRVKNASIDFSALTSGTSTAGSDSLNVESGVDFAVDIASIAIVPSSDAEGLFELANGNILDVVDNIATTFSPAAFDIEAFIAGINAANVDITVLPNGGLSISDGVIVALASFGFENAENADAGDSGPATFGGTTGADESDANYFFTVNYGNDVVQKLQPLINDDAFYDSVEGFGYSVSTDRATGIITIDGVGNFRPAYVVSPITFSEGFTHNLNKDASGVSYAVTDANSDGVMDAVVFTDSSVQLVFGMP
jgi:hypothetical protein